MKVDQQTYDAVIVIFREYTPQLKACAKAIGTKEEELRKLNDRYKEIHDAFEERCRCVGATLSVEEFEVPVDQPLPDRDFADEWAG
jgi:hypothetical protein